MNVKKRLYLACASVFILSSCVDLSYNEISTFDKDWVYGSPVYGVEKLVTNIYAHLDYDFGQNHEGAMFASATDEADFTGASSDIHNFYNGAWSSTLPFDRIWTNSYAAIAEANAFLENMNRISLDDYIHNDVGSGDLDYEKLQAKFELFPYEVRFLRAYFYFTLVRTYGDVPLVTKTLSNVEANNVSRTPAQDVFNYIVAECDAIADFLPVTYEDEFSKETGRASRPMVLALKAHALLYQASPLFNIDNDRELWRKAAVANKEMIDRAADWGITLGEYKKLWGDKSFREKEIIFGRPSGANNVFEKNNFPTGLENAKGGNCPTQSLVDAYEYTATGKSFGETWSGRTVNVTKEDPYGGLDPRFALTVVKNGDSWPDDNESPIETFRGGLNGAPIFNATTTGYYLKKFCDGSTIIGSNNANTKRHTFIIFRLAEFYLNYAEAMYQFYGDADVPGEFGLSANDAVNVVRGRKGVKMPEFSGSTGFEERYRRERMVELAFEGHRFWDVRRWKEGARYFNEISVAEFSKNAEDQLILTRTSLHRGWNEKYNLFPIPFAETQINVNLRGKQNPGW